MSKRLRSSYSTAPTKGVDVGTKERYTVSWRPGPGKAAIILISSDLPELLALSDRILVMHRGETTGELSRDEATGESSLLYAHQWAMKGVTVINTSASMGRDPMIVDGSRVKIKATSYC